MLNPLESLQQTQIEAKNRGITIQTHQKHDRLHITFRQGRFVVAQWWPRTGTLVCGPNRSAHHTIQDAWNHVKPFLSDQKPSTKPKRQRRHKRNPSRTRRHSRVPQRDDRRFYPEPIQKPLPPKTTRGPECPVCRSSYYAFGRRDYLPSGNIVYRAHCHGCDVDLGPVTRDAFTLMEANLINAQLQAENTN